jgi:fructosamine-3-kinase
VDLSRSWSDRVADELGPVRDVAARDSGMWTARVGGQTVVIKAGPATADEAAGLRLLGSIRGGPAVPAVLLSGNGLLVTPWVDQGARTAGHEEDFGRSLATLHSAPWPGWGGGSAWIGDCRVDPAETDDPAVFYGSRLGDLARRCGLGDPVGAVVKRLGDLLPPGPASLLHGDLWWGNVLWGADGRCHLIDPSVHGGHPEEDLAMLALFGPVPPRLVASYLEVHPLPPGWQERVGLWQLYPLLVHSVLFGGGYRSQAVAVARRYA